MSGNATDLIQRMLNGDPASFHDIIAWYADDVLRLCFLLLRDEEEARDIFQESLLKLAQMVKQGRFRTANGSIKGFLLTTARNLSLNRLRKHLRYEPIPEEDDVHSPELVNSYSPLQATNDARFESRFDAALAQLTDLQRTVIVLHELNGESTENIADTLDLTVENVRMHLCRARKHMRRILAPFAGEL
ncbi:MAG: RNA polymerase sigma factor [Candidatus Omnitrophota bacterium]|jgi:RNA polymerase sigma-70 factor (ECF subfamily)|nr:MAG: RNA polymerase sigma factor [Candidatus Omnitrophota bacterium]